MVWFRNVRIIMEADELVMLAGLSPGEFRDRCASAGIECYAEGELFEELNSYLDEHGLSGRVTLVELRRGLAAMHFLHIGHFCAASGRQSRTRV
jgi:hypothetical protein